MSRSGYTDDCENLNLWRGAVSKAIKGKRGQEFLKSLVSALDALPEKKLVANSFQTADGGFCALGSVGKMRGVDMSDIYSYDNKRIADTFGISMAMAEEIMYENDEGVVDKYDKNADELRWIRMRNWAQNNILKEVKL